MFCLSGAKAAHKDCGELLTLSPSINQLETVLSSSRMIPLAGGNFTMGSPQSESGRFRNENQVAVELTPFAIMDAPVTQRMWFDVMGKNPSHFKKRKYCRKGHIVIDGISLCPDHPVEGVSWNDVQEFIQKLNQMLGMDQTRGYRLPTEARWEYAARAGTTGAYSFGNEPQNLGKYAVYEDNSMGHTWPVRSKRANPWGLHDMYGNVWEWTQDGYVDRLRGGPDPLETGSTKFRVVRGGSWYFPARNLRSAYRNFSNTVEGNKHIGFRLVLDL